MESNCSNEYIIQEYIQPYRSYNIDFTDENPVFREYHNLTGLFVYNGKLKGIYSRQAETEIISDQYDENVVASVVAYNK